jgi:hypothetical protein
MIEKNLQSIENNNEIPGFDDIVDKFCEDYQINQEDIKPGWLESAKNIYNTSVEGGILNAENIIGNVNKELEKRLKKPGEQIEPNKDNAIYFNAPGVIEAIQTGNELAQENEEFLSKVNSMSFGSIQSRLEITNTFLINNANLIKDKNIRDNNPNFKDLLTTIGRQKKLLQEQLENANFSEAA